MTTVRELEYFFAVERRKSLPRFIFMAKWERIGIKYKQSLNNIRARS